MAEWPVLEDEWVLTVIQRGLRPSPDVLVALLARHRTDATRLARAAVAGGPVTRWVTEHVPELAPRTYARVDADAVLSVPPLAVPPELADLLGADAHTFASTLGRAFDAGRFGTVPPRRARQPRRAMPAGGARRSSRNTQRRRSDVTVRRPGAGARRPRGHAEPDAGRDLRDGSGERSRVTGSGELGQERFDLVDEARPRRLVTEQEVVGALERDEPAPRDERRQPAASSTGILASRRACSTSVGTDTAPATSTTSTTWNASMNRTALLDDVVIRWSSSNASHCSSVPSGMNCIANT